MTNKSKSTLPQKTNAPETLKECLFFKRLPFKLSKEQEEFRDAIYDKNNKIIFVNAKSGTGKTTIAIATACAMIEYGLYNKIIYCFSMNNGFQNTMGLLPGTAEDKEAAFYDPCLQALAECGYMPDKVVQELSQSEDISSAFVCCKSHTFLRGANIDNDTILIVDEAQNFYLDEMKKVLTRVKDNTKVIVIGHDKQCDLVKNQERSGFVPYMGWFKGKEHAAICELTENHRGWVSRIADDFCV